MAIIIDPNTLRSVPTHDELPVNKEDMLAIAKVADALGRMRLHLFCPKCRSLGMADDRAYARNDPGDREYVIYCDCTKRVYRKPM